MDKDAEIAVLRDLLETAYRKVDQARAEADKADDEAAELKAQMISMRALGSREGFEQWKEWRDRARKAERQLELSSGSRG